MSTVRVDRPNVSIVRVDRHDVSIEREIGPTCR